MKIVLKQLKEIEHSYFQIFLLDRYGKKSKQPVFEGIYSLGIKPLNIHGWIDGYYYEKIQFQKTSLHLSEKELDSNLFKKLGSTIKSGWSLMVAYEMFWGKEKTLIETSKGLNLGIPPIATPLGYLLFNAGCLKIKDWYFPEGGHEGMQKLEGMKPGDREHAKKMIMESTRELRIFLKRKNLNTELESHAKERAKKVLKLMKNVS